MTPLAGARTRPRHRPREGGSVTVEMAVLTPAFLLLVVAAIVFGRTAVALHAIDVAAHDAARAASISRTQSSAASNAESAANDALAQQGLDCDGRPGVAPDVGAFAEGGSDLRLVSVTVTCDVLFTDVALPGVPRSLHLESTFVSPVDTFRER